MRPITVTDVRAVPGDSGFLLDDGTTAVLYDSGFAFTGFAVAENIRAVLGSRPLDYILLTHSHYDHVLGVPTILSIYPNATVIAGVHAAQVFARASAKHTMEELNRKAAAKHGLPPDDSRIDQLQVHITVEDGDTVDCGTMRFTAVELPGHTHCSVGFYLAENKLFLGTETLGIRFGKDTYLPSFLVGYQITLDSFRKINRLDIRQMLLPHHGVVEGEELRTYLRASEAVTRDSARIILSMFRQGHTEAEILAVFKEKEYLEDVRPTYPIDAFLLNTSLMIDRVKKELFLPEESVSRSLV